MFYLQTTNFVSFSEPESNVSRQEPYDSRQRTQLSAGGGRPGIESRRGRGRTRIESGPKHCGTCG